MFVNNVILLLLTSDLARDHYQDCTGIQAAELYLEVCLCSLAPHTLNSTASPKHWYDSPALT